MPRLKRPSKARARRRIEFVKYAALFLVVLALAGTSVVLLLRQKALLVQSIVIEGNAAVAAADVSSIADRILDGSYLGLIPRRAILFYPRESIEKAISTIPWVSGVRVGLDGVNTLKIRINERTPLYIWCPVILSETCYFLDAAALAFAETPEFSNNVFMRFYGPLEGQGLAPGRYLSETKFKDLIRLIDTLNGISETVTMVMKRENEFELSLTKGGRILLPRDFSSESVLTNLNAALSAEPLKSRFAKERSSLDYLDLRFGNKVFFKFRE